MVQNREYLKEFRGLELLLVVPADEEGRQIIHKLRQLGATVKHSWPMPEPLPRAGEILVCELVTDIAQRTPWLPGESPLPLVLRVPRNGSINFKDIQKCAPHGLLQSPTTEKSIVTTLLHARDQFRYEQRLRSRIDKLDDNLRSMRTVEQAKVILMDTKNTSEEEAYKILRRTAMERRVRLGTLATAIVDSHELLR